MMTDPSLLGLDGLNLWLAEALPEFEQKKCWSGPYWAWETLNMDPGSGADPPDFCRDWRWTGWLIDKMSREEIPWGIGYNPHLEEPPFEAAFFGASNCGTDLQEVIVRAIAESIYDRQRRSHAVSPKV